MTKKRPHEVQWKDRGCECDIDTACAFMRERDEARKKLEVIAQRDRRAAESSAKRAERYVGSYEELRQKYVALRKKRRVNFYMTGPDRDGFLWLRYSGGDHRACIPISADSLTAKVFSEAVGFDYAEAEKALKRREIR